MLAERLRDGANVRTLAGHCHWYFRFPTGLSQGFDVWDTRAIPPGMGDNDATITSDRMSALALRLLQDPDNTSSRFFAWFHFFDPHAQYVAHKGAPEFKGPSMAKNLYDQEVWFTDMHIGKVLDFIAQQPWGDKTAVIVTADHGEAFADHGMSWHGQEIWESLVRVPLIVYVPGVPPRTVSAKRSHIDIVPTVLELFGLPVEANEGDADGTARLRGQSLLRDVGGAAERDPEERDVYIDMPAGPYNGPRRALISGTGPGLKLLHSGGAAYQLYDLAADPNEKRDLAADRALRTPMIERLQRFRSRLHEVEVKPE